MAASLDFLLSTPLESAAGVDPKRVKLYKKLLGARIIDALYHWPQSTKSTRYVEDLTHSQPDELTAFVVTPHTYAPGGRLNRIYGQDLAGNTVIIMYFQGNFSYQKTLLPLTQPRLITGKVERKGAEWQVSHPEVSKMVWQLPEPGSVTIQPVYPLTAGITNNCVLRVLTPLLKTVAADASLQEEDWIPEALRLIHGWPQWRTAVVEAHRPGAPQAARERLMFDELLAHQLSLLMVRQQDAMAQPGIPMVGGGALTAALTQALPFKLTLAQERVLIDIYKDMAAHKPMLRLLQGDVGSGKTIVAVFALLRAVEAGYQGAMLAPTDILAQQHGETIIPLLDKIGVSAALLTARDKGKKRQDILARLQSGALSVLIGTHALIQRDVVFAKLGLTVIDEQHRFGVEQRLALSQKGTNPDILSMTATPIPRTLLLANHGDMDTSIIRQKPAGRKPVKTTVLSHKKLPDLEQSLHSILAEGGKVFWVCPLVEESEVLDLTAAQARFDHMKSIFGDRVGLVHGRLKEAEKDAAMTAFVTGNVDILISTTVIEVGVNVPAATVMIIEHAQRFGLAQLHQLRGRIGRGEKAGTCILVYGTPLTAIAKERLEIMRKTNDGFEIAEADLRLRGGGDILGTRQSGMPGFRLADFANDPVRAESLLDLAHETAQAICAQDPLLSTQQGNAVRKLLHIFGHDEAAYRSG